MKTNEKLKRHMICIFLVCILFLPSCGKKNGIDPVTAIELGFTQTQALEKEPTLSEYDEYQLSCDKTFENTKGTTLVYFNSLDGEPVAKSIKWIAEPTDGTGKATYDALLTALKTCYGKPANSKDRKNVESIVSGTYDEAQARWSFEDFGVSLSYIYYPESGKCQIIYHRSVTSNA